ncbi:MAG: hypothetical protein J6I84_04050 [Bacilli bacterium]|nr:hypothetical protein [Bacilli bacterium]
MKKTIAGLLIAAIAGAIAENKFDLVNKACDKYKDLKAKAKAEYEKRKTQVQEQIDEATEADK